MNFGWSTPRAEVIDSLMQWGFTFNPDKQRWDKGMLNGALCSKLKVWFDEKDHFAGAEAKYLGLDTQDSRTLLDRYVTQLTRIHGRPDMHDVHGEDVRLERIAWSFSPEEDDMQDMIVLTHFPDYLILHTSRNMPKLFELEEEEHD